MLPVAFSLGVLLALVGGTATLGCVAPQDLVSTLLQRLQESVDMKEAPNPSVLLAMNLAGDRDSDIHSWLLQKLKEKAVETAQDMASGEVALSVLALLSSCQDPRHVHAHADTIDLVSILQQKTDEEMAYMELHGDPKTTLFSLSLDSLALCLAQAGGYEEPSVALAKKMLSSKDQVSVDTRAMVVQALACTYGHVELPEAQELLWNAVATVTKSFLDEQERRGGMIGNIYSMGPALQALQATGKFYAPRHWDCSQAFAVVYQHHYKLPMAIAEVLPALVDKPYLQAASVKCDASTGMTPPKAQADLPPELAAADFDTGATITVHYFIINELQGQPFHENTTVQVPDGSTLLTVLQAAEEKHPVTFSFKIEQVSWGPMVVSIHGLAANSNDKTYWQFLSGEDALQEGVGTYKPHDGEVIRAVFSRY